jgi:CARDB
LIGSLLLLVVVFGFIFFVARGCVATQQSTQVRKYVTSADSLLSDSSNAGRGELQGILSNAGGDASKLDDGALSQVANRTEQQYQQALQQEEIPPEFEDAHHYIVTALGIRSQATDDLAQAASGDEEGFKGELATAVADYRTSDAIIASFYIPAVKRSLETAGQTGDQAYLQEPQSFMDYRALGFDAAPTSGTTQSDPDALHGVQVTSVKVADKPLYQGGNVVLTGSDEPTFTVRVTNGGEVPETAVDVEVILNTAAERQSKSKTIDRLEPKKTTTVEVGGFIPGELDETARVTVEAGPVEYEKSKSNNTLTGTVKFGI